MSKTAPRISLAVVALLGLAFAAPSHAAVDDSQARAARAAESTLSLDLGEAKKALEGGDPDSPFLGFEKARLLVYEGDCDGALVVLARPELAKTEAGAQLADLARGCARVTAATVVERDDAASIEIRYQDENDRALAPLIKETIIASRDSLTRDLGVTWPKPTRITIVRDLLSLAAMTGLPYEAATTTGTVAVAKWGRVTLLSPRASRHGYSWRDTIAHELTHLAVTRATADRAPLWLQEGMAKREEVRWRAPGPFDDRPPVDSIVVRGIEMKMDLPLDKLGPSIAMLPSADAALVAFAEVTSFVRYVAQTSPEGAMQKLLAELRAKKSVDGALLAATGADLKGWDVQWRAGLAGTKKDLSVLEMMGLGGAHANARDTHERMRLAELLYGREHPEQALAELAQIPAKDFGKDPSVRHMKARTLEALDRRKEGEPLVADPKDVSASFSGWWAIRGRWARDKDDLAVADPAFVEAVAANPFDTEAACETLDPAKSPTAAEARLLCEAARKMGEPPLGKD